jgi:hypothetical protein
MVAINDIPDAGFRSQMYYVARTTAQCQDCGLPTCLLALALPRGHEMRDGDAQDKWHPADANAFLFYVELLSDDVEQRLQELSRHFHPARSRATQSTYWANHCQHCGTLFEDHELHCEPDGPFMPSSEASAADVELLRIDESLQAAAAGYAPEPQFFGFMRGG